MSNARNLSKLFPLSALVGLVGQITAAFNANATVPAGSVFDYALTTAPTGYVMCYGQTIPNDATHATLRTALIAAGNPYGTDGTNPRVPDARGRVIAGKDDMGGAASGVLTNSGTGNPGISGITLGATGGVDRHTLTIPQIPSHNHGIYQDPTVGANNGISRQASSVGSQNGTYCASTGGGEAHPNVQPTIVLNKIIKL